MGFLNTPLQGFVPDVGIKIDLMNIMGCLDFDLMPTVSGLGVFTKQRFNSSDIVFDWSNLGVIAEQDFRTVQFSRDSHILELTVLRYLNHSCAPNIFVDTQRRQCLALRSIAVGDELSFFYPSTEWELSRSFVCHCRALGCLGTVSSAKNMDDSQLRRHRLNDHILVLKAADGVLGQSK